MIWAINFGILVLNAGFLVGNLFWFAVISSIYHNLQKEQKHLREKLSHETIHVKKPVKP